MSKGRSVGSVVKARPERDMRARLWQSMRVLMRFTQPQLLVTTDAGRSNTRDYVARLIAVGHLRVVVKQNSAAKRPAVYHLVRNTGPKAPITRRDGNVYDQNEGITYAPGGAIVNKGESDGQASE